MEAREGKGKGMLPPRFDNPSYGPAYLVLVVMSFVIGNYLGVPSRAPFELIPHACIALAM